jgi:hexosaminidase
MRRRSRNRALRTLCSESYPGDGPASLTDGLLAQTNHQDVAWLGFQEDCVATIAWGEPVVLTELAASFLQSVAVGIFLPRQVEFWAGNDPASLQLLGTVKPVMGEKQAGPLKEMFTLKPLHRSARCVEVRAANVGKIPAWHAAAGAKAWLFCDEILVNPVEAP